MGQVMKFDDLRKDGFFTEELAQADPEVFTAIEGELQREQDQIELIASENIVSRAVMQAQGSVMTNKYAEGYPGKRYYQGCAHVDDAADDAAIPRLHRQDIRSSDRDGSAANGTATGGQRIPP